MTTRHATYLPSVLFARRGNAPGLANHSHGLGEQTTIHGIDYRLSADLATAEEPTVESLDGVLSALHLVEL